MSFSFDDLAQGAIENIFISVLWKGITRLFRFWGRWIDWNSPAGILLIAMIVLNFAMWYFVHIRSLDFWRGALVAAAVIFFMLMMIHINIMARVEKL